MSSWKDTTLRVRYQETDQMGVVYHANYLVWFEIGRTHWIRSMDITYKDLEAKGLLLPVIDAHLRYRYPARYDETVVVRTRLQKMRSSGMTFEYEVVRERENDVLVTGETKHVWLDRDRWKPVRFEKKAPDIAERLNAILQREG